MSMREMQELAPGYTVGMDAVDERLWADLLLQFDDANIYQTGPYGEVTRGHHGLCRLILRHNGNLAAMAQVKIVKVPLLRAGIAYVLWGPVWRRSGTPENTDLFRQAIRALRNEFVCRRGLALRLFPVLFADGSSSFQTILAEEGFAPVGEAIHKRTILMDLTQSLESLRDGMRPHWKRYLKVAEKNGLEIVEGSGTELIESFISIYKEMVSRKNFAEPNDIRDFLRIQAQLPEALKMKILLCKSGGEVCAGLICSAIGNSAVYLFGATSNAGLEKRGSYLLHWTLIGKLKQENRTVYNLNGINPVANPGTYKFKSDLAGSNSKDLFYLGRFDSHAGAFSHFAVACGERLRALYRSVRELPRTLRAAKVQSHAGN